MEVSGRRARYARSSGTVSPANRADPGARDASQGVARVVSDVSVCVPGLLTAVTTDEASPRSDQVAPASSFTLRIPCRARWEPRQAGRDPTRMRARQLARGPGG